MSGTPGSTWYRLLDQKKATFLAHGYAIPITTTNEDVFRTHFEELCRKHREGYYTQWFAKLRLGRVDAFMSAVNATFNNAHPDSLTSLVLGGVLVAFQGKKRGIEAGIPLTDAAKLLGELNIVVPSLGADIPRFLDNHKLRDVLQEIFSTYTDSLSCMVSNFSLRPGAPESDRRLAHITKNIEESRMTSEKERAALAQFLEEAEQMKQQETIYTPNVQAVSQEVFKLENSPLRHTNAIHTTQVTRQGCFR